MRLGEGLRYANQAQRRRMPHSSMCAFWSFNEPFANAVYLSVVEYGGSTPKMAFYPADARRSVLASLLVAAFALTPPSLVLPAAFDVTAPSTDHLWAIGRTPFGPYAESTELTFSD